MKRIAIVEDELFMREELSGILQKADYEVEEISEFGDAAKQLLKLSPDLVLLDLNLPVSSGFQICREIKQRLLARVSNVLKRYEGRQNLLEGPECLLDRLTYTLYIHNSSVVLPRNQGKILEMFLLHGEEPVSKEELCMAIWGTTEFIDENALQVNLTRLKNSAVFALASAPVWG